MLNYFYIRAILNSREEINSSMFENETENLDSYYNGEEMFDNSLQFNF